MFSVLISFDRTCRKQKIFPWIAAMEACRNHTWNIEDGVPDPDDPSCIEGHLPGLSIVRKLCPPKIKRTIREYFTLHQSLSMKKRLTEKPMGYAIRQRQKGIGDCR